MKMLFTTRLCSFRAANSEVPSGGRRARSKALLPIPSHGIKELCPLPKCESNPEAPEDWATNMQGLLLQGL